MCAEKGTSAQFSKQKGRCAKGMDVQRAQRPYASFREAIETDGELMEFFEIVSANEVVLRGPEMLST
jgi:hypothetical protein